MVEQQTASTSPASSFPSFREFYIAVNGRAPLPWQERLAARAADGDWPAEIGVPTGLGKTASLDIGVWALASQADRAARLRTAPTRLWYVVDRRLLVDSAYEHGLRLQQLLGEAARGPLAAVAAALRHVAGGSETAPPLHVTRLRGAAELGARSPHPAQPTLCFATVAMYGSRLLFRGYGSSTSMRPIDAALAGTDSLVLLDEAHLAPALVDLSGPLVDCDLGDPGRLLGEHRARPRLVALTATGRAAGSQRFDLDGTDHAHPLVQRRLMAAKPTVLVETTRRSLATSIANETLAGIAAADQPPACLVFVNTTKLAGEVADKLRSELDDVVVLTGRLRSREATVVRDRLLGEDGLRAGRADHIRSEPLVVVATQTLEVGADLDADLLVTQSAGVRALVQRFGRLNRLGDRPHAHGVIVHAADDKDPVVYGAETNELWARLCEQVDSDGVVHLSPSSISEMFGTPQDQPGRAGELLPTHLWEWAKTTVPPHGEAPPELFFAGIDEDPARVAVMWRAWLPQDGERCLPPIRQQEAVEVSIALARKLLDTRGEPGASCRLARDGSTVEGVTVDTVRPGDTLLLDTSQGGYDPVLGLDPDATDAVFDVSVLTGSMLPLRREAIMHLLPGTPSANVADCFHPVAEARERDEAPSLADWDRVRHALVSLLADNQPQPAVEPAEWVALQEGVSHGHLQFPQPGDTPVVTWSSRRVGTDTPVASDVFDDLSFDATSVALDDHLDSVGEIAARLGHAVGLPDRIVETLRVAGELHDIGKADVRFQRWLAPKGSDQPLAKSTGSRREFARQAAGWPQGGRHEVLSARLLDAAVRAGLELPADSDPELVRHLVLTHHGHGRASLPAVEDALPTRVRHRVYGHDVTADGDLASEELEQPRRFRALNGEFGYWGLALLEAVLRQADHIASRTTEVA